jgi:hypothetical protein
LPLRWLNLEEGEREFHEDQQGNFHWYVHLGMYNFEWAAEDDVRRMAMA